MRKRLADLHVVLDPIEVAASASWIRTLDIDLLGLTARPPLSSPTIQKALSSLEDAGVEARTRLDLGPDEADRPLRKLAAWRTEFDLVAGEVTSTHALRALLHSKVDLLFAERAHSRLLGPRSFELLARAGKAWELNLRQALHESGRQKAQALRELARQLSLADDAGVTILASSGARSRWEMRPPRENANLLTLLGLEQAKATETVSSNALILLGATGHRWRRPG